MGLHHEGMKVRPGNSYMTRVGGKREWVREGPSTTGEDIKSIILSQESSTGKSHKSQLKYKKSVIFFISFVS